MADEPERRIAGVILAELEQQGKDGNLSVGMHMDGAWQIQVQGYLDVYSLVKAILAETSPPERPKQMPRLIEYDLPVRQTADLDDAEEAPLALWEVPMKPRNLPSAEILLVNVEANSAEEAISKALSAKPGHSWGTPKQIGTTHP